MTGRENGLGAKQKAIKFISACLNFPTMNEWDHVTSLSKARLILGGSHCKSDALIYFKLVIISNPETTFLLKQ